MFSACDFWRRRRRLLQPLPHAARRVDARMLATRSLTCEALNMRCSSARRTATRSVARSRNRSRTSGGVFALSEHAKSRVRPVVRLATSVRKANNPLAWPDEHATHRRQRPPLMSNAETTRVADVAAFLPPNAISAAP